MAIVEFSNAAGNGLCQPATSLLAGSSSPYVFLCLLDFAHFSSFLVIYILAWLMLLLNDTR